MNIKKYFLLGLLGFNIGVNGVNNVSASGSFYIISEENKALEVQALKARILEKQGEFAWNNWGAGRFKASGFDLSVLESEKSVPNGAYYNGVRDRLKKSFIEEAIKKLPEEKMSNFSSWVGQYTNLTLEDREKFEKNLSAEFLDWHLLSIIAEDEEDEAKDNIFESKRNGTFLHAHMRDVIVSKFLIANIFSNIVQKLGMSVHEVEKVDESFFKTFALSEKPSEFLKIIGDETSRLELSSKMHDYFIRSKEAVIPDFGLCNSLLELFYTKFITNKKLYLEAVQNQKVWTAEPYQGSEESLNNYNAQQLFEMLAMFAQRVVNKPTEEIVTDLITAQDPYMQP